MQILVNSADYQGLLEGFGDSQVIWKSVKLSHPESDLLYYIIGAGSILWNDITLCIKYTESVTTLSAN